MCRVAAILSFLLTAAVARGQPASAPAVQPGPPTPVTVTVDFSALSPEVSQRIDALGLESRVILRLIQEGFAVVAAFAAPDVQVRAEEINGSVRLTATGGGGAESVTVTLGTGTRAELQLEMAQKAVDLARTRVAAVQVARLKAQPPPRPPPSPLRPLPYQPDAPIPRAPRPITVNVTLGAAALWRGPGVDPMAQLSLGIDTRGLFGVGVSFGVNRSTAPGLDPAERGLTVTEWQITTGPRFHLLRAGQWFTDVAAEVGVVSHEYTYQGIGVIDPEGDKLDVLGLVPITFGYRLTDVFEVSLRLAPGIAGRNREHRRDGVVIWEREAARLEAGGQVGFRF